MTLLTDLPIVVVEDDPEVLALFGDLLEGQGFAPLLFGSSLDAFEFLRGHEAAAIILDLLMPHMSGLDLLRYLKAHKGDTPVIMVSGNGHIDTAIECMHLGAADYIPKPFTATRIAKSLATVLEGRVKKGELPPAGAGEPARPEVPEGVPERMRKAAAYMVRNLSRPLYLEGIAQEACLSKFHFCREFKKFFGVSPMRFMLQRRIALATSLLEAQEGAPISVVAMQCGFSDQSEFTKWFKKATGLTPSRYRNARNSAGQPPQRRKSNDSPN